MPFKSRSQARACYAKKDPNWNCQAWEAETPNRKALPERVKPKAKSPKGKRR